MYLIIMIIFLTIMSNDILKFTNIEPVFEETFWTRIYSNKLNEYKLNVVREEITGTYNNDTNSILKLNSSSFNIMYNGINMSEKYMKGDILVVNTMDELKDIVVIQANPTMINLWKAIQTGIVFNDHQMLNRFVISAYVDLKKYKFYYWTGFPVFKLPNIKIINQCKLIDLLQDYSDCDLIHTQIQYIWDYNDPNIEYFLYLHTLVEPLTFDYLLDVSISNMTLIVNDMGGDINNPNWNIRNLLFALSYHISSEMKLTLICYRENSKYKIEDSPVFEIVLQPLFQKDIKMKNGIPEYYKGLTQLLKKTIKPDIVDLSQSMDPSKFARSSLELNLRLMKWQMSPNLDLKNISNTKCLLFGAGTLGSHVARNLLGWGITNITFVDNGEVSYSNPVRQSLFFQDDVGKNKAETAANNLKKIYSNANTKGVNITIPMPDHPIHDQEAFRESLETLDQLVREHDAIFLLTDTRESRWFPAFLAKLDGIPCFTAAIGFDTYVAMRHGKTFNESGPELGCYFCSDVLELNDTTKNATMDKKCTVSRPGVSAMASAMVTELMVACIATKKNKTNVLTDLDDIPQQIRGNVSTFETKCFHMEQSTLCMACSDTVHDTFKENPVEFINNVMTQKGYLTELLQLNIDIDCDYPEDTSDQIIETIEKTIQNNEKITQHTISVEETDIVDDTKTESEITITENNIVKLTNTDDEFDGEDFQLTEQEKVFLLPIINKQLKKPFMNIELAKETYDSYSKEEQLRLQKKYDDCYTNHDLDY